MSSINYKSLEDIQNDINSLINGIDDDKKETETQIQNVIVELDNNFKVIQQKEIEIISQLNSTNQSLKSKYNQKIEEIINLLEDSTSFFFEYVHLFKSTFKISLISIITFFVILAFFYDSLMSIAPWLKNSLFGMPTIIFLILSLLFILILRAYLKTNIKLNSDLKDLEITKLKLKNSKYACNLLPIPKDTHKKTEVSIMEVKSILGSLLFNVGKTIPVVNQAYEELNLLSKYRRLVESFEYTLSYYNLWDEEDYFSNLAKTAPITAHALNDDKIWKDIISKQIVEILNENNIPISKNLLMLLYHEHNDLETKNLFRQISTEEDELEKLTSILINSQKLVAPSSKINYNQRDIVSLLKDLEDFNLSEINSLLARSFRLVDYLKSYIEFLHKNGIVTPFQPTIEFVITESNSLDNSFEKEIISLVYKAGTIIFSEIEKLDNTLIDGFTRASISLKFHDDISLREIACKCSGEDASTAIIRTYYEKYNEIDRQQIVSLDELIANLELINFYLENIDEQEMQFLKAQLREGKWYDSSVAYIIDFITKSNANLKEEFTKLGDLKILKESVTSVFKKVKIGTIEKAIDSQIFSAYIIMSDSSEGNLTDIIDELSIRNSKASSGEKKWEIKSFNLKKGIENKYGIKLKYDFVQFSNSTRIGILPKGESFVDFQNAFFDDIKKMLNHDHRKNETFKIGLVVQKITPSKYSFGILDDEELSSNIRRKNLDVARYIARLAIDYVSLEEKVSVMKFEKDIDLLEIANHKSIYELIRKDKDDIKKKEIKILEAPQLKNDLIQEINENLGIGDFKSLAMHLHAKHIEKTQLNEVVSSILEVHLSTEPNLEKNAPVRAKRLSERFSDALEKLAYIYELQNN